MHVEFSERAESHPDIHDNNHDHHHVVIRRSQRAAESSETVLVVISKTRAHIQSPALDGESILSSHTPASIERSNECSASIESHEEALHSIHSQEAHTTGLTQGLLRATNDSSQRQQLLVVERSHDSIGDERQ